MVDARTARRIGAGLVVLALGVVVLRVLVSDPEVLPGGPSRAPVRDGERTEAAPLERELAVVARTVEAPAAVRGAPAARIPPSASRWTDARTSFIGQFRGPDDAEIRVASARIVFTGSRGSVHEASVVDATSVSISDLEYDEYRVQVTAPGYEHREERFTLEQPYADQNMALILWPSGWVAVVVRMPDGRSFHELADEMGIEPKRLFVDAFDVRTSRELLGDDAWKVAYFTQPALWRKPPGYQNWWLPDASVGSLQVIEPPPFWVGLAVHGVPLGWQMLNPGDREVVFRLDAPSLEGRLATLHFRVLDAPSGSPRSDARVTLKANTSAHRREDQANVTPALAGQVELRRIVPGRYELSIEGDGALHQALLEIAPGEDRDLGDIVLRRSRAVLVHAVDESGNHAKGWVEIAPYRPGQKAQDLYPPNLHRNLDENGEFLLPMPSEASIVRVTLADVLGRQTNHVSPSVILDPDRPPPARIELVARYPQEVRLGLPRDREPFVRVEVRDELGLVAECLTPHPDSASVRMELAPGRYFARRIDAAGQGLPATPFLVADQRMELALP